MHNTIAVGASDQAASRTAIEWATSRAARSAATVVLVHVVDEAGLSTAASSAEWALTDEIDRARTLSPRSEVHTRNLQGSVTWTLVAASDDYDLIVIGTHKTGFIHRAVYGTGGLSLAANAACPVVVVPAAALSDPQGVLVGADDSSAGLAALEFAASEAAATAQLLTIIRVSPAPPSRLRRDTELASLLRDDRLLARLQTSARAKHPTLPIRQRRILGPTAEVLVAASTGARLLVLGDSQTGSSAPRSLGVVCHDALLNIRVPTAIVHSPDLSPETPRPSLIHTVTARRAGADDGLVRR